MAAKFDPSGHMIKLQGKDYLPVAARIVWMRGEHPDWSIVTEPVTIGQAVYMRATVATDDGRILATAHKAATGRKGTAAQYPIEAAETGAIGRALGLCGYGTLSEDLDEGDEIADSPQDRPTNGHANGAPAPAGKAPRHKAALVDLPAVLGMIELVTTAGDLATARNAANAIRAGLTADEKAKLRDALATAEATLAGMVPASGTV